MVLNDLSSQIGFIDFLVNPLYDAWFSFSKTEYTQLCMTNLSNNRKLWAANADNPNLLPGVGPDKYDDQLEGFLELNIPEIYFGVKAKKKKPMSTKRRSETVSMKEANFQISITDADSDILISYPQNKMETASVK
jgi:hypothetical protein